MVDADGRLYNGDELLYLMVDRPPRAAASAVAGVVGTLMTNMAVELALRERGIEFVRAKVGDRYVLEELDRARLAARRRGLGPPAGARQAHHRRRHRQRAAGAAGGARAAASRWPQLLEGVTLFPQTLINVRLRRGSDWKANRALAGRAATRSSASSATAAAC